MKKLLLLFLSVIALTGCSKDDDANSTPDYEVLSYSYEVEESTVDGHVMKFTATVKNNTDEGVNGRVQFTIPEDDGTSFDYITGVILDAGETATFTDVGGGLYDSQNLNITDVKFMLESDFE